MENIKMWIARDEGIYNEDYELVEKGKLHLFYDKPLKHIDSQTNTTKFDCARCIGEIPSYMYPQIEECAYFEIRYSDNDLITEKDKYKKELEKLSKQVVQVLKVKSLRGCEYKNWEGFCNGLGEDIGYDIEELIKMAEKHLRR